MRCSQCQAENPESHRFCSECGTPMAVACPACGFANQAGGKFCGGCGAPLGAAPPPPAAQPAADPATEPMALDGERRQVTVLFADLAGYTRLSSELDPEETHALLNRFFEAVDQVVQRYGGAVDKHIGDSVMAVFGAPLAHDDDPERAVRAALDIHRAVAAASEAAARPLAVHVGVASGEVVASGTGSAAHSEYTVTGDTVNLASRLQDMAKSGETLMSEAVRGAVERRVECTALEEVSIKGLPRPVRVWRVLGLRTVEGAAQPLVGRRTELRQFEGALAGCTETGAGQAVLVRGEAGIGKSRLLAEFRARAAQAGFTCHMGQVLDFGVGLGQDAVRTVVGGLLNLAANADEAVRRAAVDAALGDGLAHEDQRVFLNELLGVSQPTELRAMYDAMDDAARRRGEHEAVAALVGALSRRQPLLIQIEDIHWADAPVLAHLAALAAAIAGYPALLVLSSRIEGDPLDQAWRAASRGCPLLTIDLAPLRPDEAMAFAAEYIDTSNRLAQECVKRAEGNPLFLEQLLRSAREHEEEGVPASIQSLILARMDRLPTGEKKALQAATVIGQRFALETLRFLLDEPSYDCRALVEHYLVRPEGDDFLFDHALIREGIYGSLLKAARRALHGRAAQWFAERDAVLCAEHLDRADDPAAAGAYLAAAQAQADEYRYERAIALVERGLALAQSNGETFGLTELRAELLRSIGRPAESIEAYRAALGLAADDAERCAAWIGIAAGVRLSGGYDDGIEALARAEEIALRARHDRALSQIYFYRGTLYFAHADVDGCLEQQQRAVRHAEQADDAEWRARALSGLGDAYYARGRMKTALDCYRQCLGLCREHGFGQIEVAALYIAANIRRYMNEFEAACQEIGAAVEMAGKIGNLRAEMYARMLEGEFLIERDERARAETTLERAHALADGMGNRRFMAYVMHHQARCLLGRQRPAEALALLAEALAISRETGISFIGPRILGTTALAATDAAVKHDALAEGEEVVRAGCFAHNVMWFYRDAMDASLADGAWDEAERYANALADYTRPEPLPWSDLFIARGRALTAHGRGRRDPETLAALGHLRDEAIRVGFVAALPGLEAALGGAEN